MPSIPVFSNAPKFLDIPEGSWFESEMAAAATFGVISVDANLPLARPQEYVSRAAFIKMTVLTFGLPQNLAYTYKDVKKGDWFGAYAGIAERLQFFPSQDKMLRPAIFVTRAEASTIVRAVLAWKDVSDPVVIEEKRIAKEQAEQKLQIYQIISSKKDQVTVMPSPAAKQAPAPVAPQSTEQARAALLSLLNAVRAKQGIAPLKVNEALNVSAQAYARQMSEEGFFSHMSPQGNSLRDRIAATGYGDDRYSADCFCTLGIMLGENLARGQKTPEEAVRDWLKSPTHPEAIMRKAYTDVGFGVSAGYWVTHFGGLIEPK